MTGRAGSGSFRRCSTMNMKMKEAEGMVTHVNSEHTVDIVRRHGSVGQYEILGSA